MLFVLLMLFLVAHNVLIAQQERATSLVKKGNQLFYQKDSRGNRIPDFSGVGYSNDRDVFPKVQVQAVVEATDSYADSLIQAAVDRVATLPLQDGFRGAVLLKKGRYRIRGTIRITASGIVLRGEGPGTVLIATGRGQRNLVSVTGTGEIREIEGSRRIIDQEFVSVGSSKIRLKNTDGIRKGMPIILFRPGTAAWIHDLKMDSIEARDSTKQWTPAEYNLMFERKVVSVEGKMVELDHPVMMEMESRYGGGAVFAYRFDGRIENVGVEYLNCESEFSSDTDEDHGWNAIFFNRVNGGWVRSVNARFFGYSCVNLGGSSRNITVDSCSYVEPKSQVTGGRRYSFNNDGQLNLVKNCFASEGRHDYVTGARVLGPNVFYNCRSVNARADIGPHHRWAVGTLYDHIFTDGEINVQDRGNWGTGHGWSGVTQVIWNCEASKAAVQDPWVSGYNWVIGLKATPIDGRLKGRPKTIWQSAKGKPESLYLYQQKEFLKRIK